MSLPTIIICTYNNAGSLARTLECLTRQTAGTDFPVLVVDNNSTDDTARVVADFSKKLPGLHYVMETVQGQIHARRRGVAETRTEWLAFVDDDNSLAPDWLEEAGNFASRHAQCGVFAGKNLIIWEVEPPALVRDCAYAYAALDLGGEELLLEGETRWVLRGAGLVCRKKALLEAGWLDWMVCTGRKGSGGTSSGDDTEIVMRIARAGYELFYVPGLKLEHHIAAKRLNVDYLCRLHHGFGVADPLLIGLKTPQSLLQWRVAMGVRLIRLFVTVLRQLPGAVRGGDYGRAKCKMWWAFFRGAVEGLADVKALEPAMKRRWLQTGIR